MDHRKQLILGVVLIALGAALFILLSKKQSLTPQTSVVSGIPQNVKEIGFTPAFTEAEATLSNAHNANALLKKYGVTLSTAERSYLDSNKFILIPASRATYGPVTASVGFDEMLAMFDDLGGNPLPEERQPEDTVFVTPDIVLHAYHKFFELTLEELEKTDLSARLERFLGNLSSTISDNAKNASGTAKERYQNIGTELAVARVLLANKSPAKPDYFNEPSEEESYAKTDETIDSFDNAKKLLPAYSAGLPADLVSKAEAELKLMYDASSPAQSPLWGQYKDNFESDYTQYTPRSHYTKSSALRAYFRTMMYLGRNSYFLGKNIGVEDANLIAAAFVQKTKNGTPEDDWKKIMDVTSFYAGVSDDITYTEWSSFMRSSVGAGKSASVLVGEKTVASEVAKLDTLRKPKILSDVIIDEDITDKTKADLLRETLAFRIFGQRFTFDAWILNDLTAGQEKTDIKRPSMPSALLVSAAIGDNQAKEYSKTFLKGQKWNDADISAFVPLIDAKRADIAKVKPEEWFASMGSGWLYMLSSLTNTFGNGYPLYMQSTPFHDKQLQAFLGSYAELKHDTLLYAKQSYAEKGGGGGEEKPPLPIVRGFVEPNMLFWNRLLALIGRTHDIFTKNDLFSSTTGLYGSAMSRLEEFQDQVAFYSSIAEKELKNEKITDEEYEKLRVMQLSYIAQPFENIMPDSTSSRVALVADIHTDALTGNVLYEATAEPYLMIALVGNENAPRAVAGLAFNHYEFTKPLERRLTDEDWKKTVYETKNLPAKNFWYSSLMAR